MKYLVATIVMVITFVLVPSASASEIAKITASDGAAGDNFGRSVAINDNTVIVGAPHNINAGYQSGSAYLFDAGTGSQLAELTATDGASGDFFGWSVAVSGNTAIVGALYDSDAGSQSGSAYLFDVATGNQVTKLTASDAVAGDWFGCSVAISGNIAIVGAWRSDGFAGAAYLYDVTTGSQIAKLTANDAMWNDRFGALVAISGNTAIIGAMNDDGGRGSAYLFDVTTGNQIAKLTATDAAAFDYFGTSVAISGNTAIVGAHYDDDGGTNSGAAYLFDVTTGNQIAKLTATDAAAEDYFGEFVGISGNTAIVGAWRNDDNGNDSGSAYLFDVSTGNQIAKLLASDATAGDAFGIVAISSNTAIVGALLDNDGSGSAYLYAVPEPATLSLLALGGIAMLRRRRK